MSCSSFSKTKSNVQIGPDEETPVENVDQGVVDTVRLASLFHLFIDLFFLLTQSNSWICLFCVNSSHDLILRRLSFSDWLVEQGGHILLAKPVRAA